MDSQPSHYDQLEIDFPWFLNRIGFLPRHAHDHSGLIVAHGDKCQQYEHRWQEAGVPFIHGCCLYLLSYITPWSLEVRNTAGGRWVDPADWVIHNYHRFRSYLPPVKDYDHDAQH